jgi:hypothetical protein
MKVEDIRNIQLEHNFTLKGSRSFRYFIAYLRIPENAAKKFKKEESKPGIQNSIKKPILE